MKITHILQKEGGKWETFGGAAEWTRNGFTRAGFTDYAYRFDNGDIWDKVNGWRDDPFNITNVVRQYKAKSGAVIEYDPKPCSPEQVGKYWTTQCIMPIITTNQGSIYSCSISPRGDDLWPARDTSVSPSMRGTVHGARPSWLHFDDIYETNLNEGEQLCSRHLWQ